MAGRRRTVCPHFLQKCPFRFVECVGKLKAMHRVVYSLSLSSGDVFFRLSGGTVGLGEAHTSR